MFGSVCRLPRVPLIVGVRLGSLTVRDGHQGGDALGDTASARLRPARFRSRPAPRSLPAGLSLDTLRFPPCRILAARLARSNGTTSHIVRWSCRTEERGGERHKDQQRATADASQWLDDRGGQPPHEVVSAPGRPGRTAGSAPKPRKPTAPEGTKPGRCGHAACRGSSNRRTRAPRIPGRASPG
jgi:hypothetical protein